MYYVIDKQNGHMMGIFDDQLHDIDCDVQMEPFNLAQLSQVITTLEQTKQMLQVTTDYSTRVHPKILDLLSVPEYTPRF